MIWGENPLFWETSIFHHQLHLQGFFSPPGCQLSGPRCQKASGDVEEKTSEVLGVHHGPNASKRFNGMGHLTLSRCSCGHFFTFHVGKLILCMELGAEWDSSPKTMRETVGFITPFLTGQDFIPLKTDMAKWEITIVEGVKYWAMGIPVNMLTFIFHLALLLVTIQKLN